MFNLVCFALALFISAAPVHTHEDSSSIASMVNRTVLIEVSCSGSPYASGSGFIWRGDKIVTANHVIDDLEKDECSATARRDGEIPFPIVVVATDKAHDLALVRSDRNYGIGTRLALAELGEPITVVGYPSQLLDRGNHYLSILFGHISTLDIKTSDGTYLHRISAAIYYGNSGGPVFNNRGEVVGIVVSGHMEVQGYFYINRPEDIAAFISANAAYPSYNIDAATSTGRDIRLELEDFDYRFRSKIETDDNDCWLWSASTNRDGYGQYHYNGKIRAAHRHAYEQSIGQIPDGLHVDHLCRVRSCVNPKHLDLVSRAENMKRARRSHCKRGHEYTEANTYKSPRGARVCRKCTSLRNKKNSGAEDIATLLMDVR